MFYLDLSSIAGKWLILQFLIMAHGILHPLIRRFGTCRPFLHVNLQNAKHLEHRHQTGTDLAVFQRRSRRYNKTSGQVSWSALVDLTGSDLLKLLRTREGVSSHSAPVIALVPLSLNTYLLEK